MGPTGSVGPLGVAWCPAGGGGAGGGDLIQGFGEGVMILLRGPDEGTGNNGCGTGDTGEKLLAGGWSGSGPSGLRPQ